MARRKSRSRSVRGKPNYLWIATAGELALIEGQTVYDSLLIPADWSGTVTEAKATLLRMVLSVYTLTANEDSSAMANNAVVYMGDATAGGGSDTNDITNYQEWPDFMISNDRILRIFRLEWAGTISPGAFSGVTLPVQYSQLPDPVMNLKTPRRLDGQDSVRLGVGGGFSSLTNLGTYSITWFCRSLVRTGLR